VESKYLKLTKYLVLGESVKNAFHGVKLPKYLFLIILLFCSGCSCFSDKRIVVKSKPEPIDNRQRWLVLAPLIKQHFKTDMTVAEIAAELALQEYYLNINQSSSGQGKR